MSPPSADSLPRRALIADDEDMVRDFCAFGLQRMGYEVETVESVAAAKERIALDGGLDLVVIDLVFPDGSGGEIYATLLEHIPTAAVLLSSGYDAHDVLTGVGEGCAFLPKPYSLQELEAAVARALGGEEQVA